MMLTRRKIHYRLVDENVDSVTMEPIVSISVDPYTYLYAEGEENTEYDYVRYMVYTGVGAYDVADAKLGGINDCMTENEGRIWAASPIPNVAEDEYAIIVKIQIAQCFDSGETPTFLTELPAGFFPGTGLGE